MAISTEVWHELALKADGTVFAWGYNGYGAATVPAGLSDVLSISAGYQQSTALKKDGTLVVWGTASAVASVPPGLSNVMAVASGDYNSIGLAPVNLPPRPSTSSALGEINKDLVIRLSGWDPNGDPLRFTITSPPAVGSIFQYSATGRGPQITANNALTDDSRLIFAPDTGAFGAPLTSFDFTASDGEFVSTNKTVNVTIIPRPVIDTITIERNPLRATVSFDGISNATYRVRATTDLNLAKGLYLGVATQTVASGKFFFTDTSASNYPYRFYYLSSP